VCKISRFQIYPILALAILLHLTILDHIRIFGVKPDLMLIIIIFFGLFQERRAGLEYGFAAGFAKDLFTLDFLGVNTLVMAVSGFLAGLAGSQLSRESKKTQALLVMALTAVSMTLHFVIASTFSRWGYLDFGEYLTSSVIPTCVYTALVSIPVLHWFIRAYGFGSQEEYL